MDYGTTTDGVPITEGLPVFTNEMRVGVVRLGRHRHSPGWFDVESIADADGPARTVMQNGERVATVFRDISGKRRVAADEWAVAMARHTPEEQG